MSTAIHCTQRRTQSYIRTYSRQCDLFSILELAQETGWPGKRIRIADYHLCQAAMPASRFRLPSSVWLRQAPRC